MVDTVVIENANPPANPSLEEEAASKGIDVSSIDTTAAEQTAAPKILGKFNTQEDLEKAYVELQRKLGKGETEAEVKEPQKEEEQSPKTEEQEAPKEEEKTAEEQAKEATEAAGLNLEELSDKYWENGALDEADYEAFAKAGIPKEYVDAFAEGQKAIAELATAKVHGEVGGEQVYQDMIDWAASSFSEAEIASYDKAVASDDMTDVMNAVKGLKARYEAANGAEPSRTVTGKGRATASDTYASIAELQADMSDPRYQKDPAFRAKVEGKLGRSDIL